MVAIKALAVLSINKAEEVPEWVVAKVPLVPSTNNKWVHQVLVAPWDEEEVPSTNNKAEHRKEAAEWVVAKVPVVPSTNKWVHQVPVALWDEVEDPSTNNKAEHRKEAEVIPLVVLVNIHQVEVQ